MIIDEKDLIKLLLKAFELGQTTPLDLAEQEVRNIVQEFFKQGDDDV